MCRPVLLASLVAVLVLAPSAFAQGPAADAHALVQQVYADLALGDIPAVLAVLDADVVWTEGAHSPQVGRYLGAGAVASHVLLPQLPARSGAGVPDAFTAEGDRIVAVGTTRRTDPASGRLIVARFRHVWRVRDGRVVGVHRSDDGPDLMASDLCGPESC